MNKNIISYSLLFIVLAITVYIFYKESNYSSNKNDNPINNPFSNNLPLYREAEGFSSECKSKTEGFSSDLENVEEFASDMDWDTLNPPKGNNDLYIAMIADDFLDIYYDKGSKSNIAAYSHPNVKWVGRATCCRKIFKFVVKNFNVGDRLILYNLNSGGWDGYFAGHIYWKGKFFPTNNTNFKITSVETKTKGIGNPGGKYAVAGGRIGCYMDQKTGSMNRKLPNLLATNQTNEECRDLALQQNYKYYGMQFGGECWAGNDLALATSAGQMPTEACNMPSKKNDLMRVTQQAGNANMNDIYNTMTVPGIRHAGAANFDGIHPSAHMLKPEIGGTYTSNAGPNHWYEWEFKPADVIEPELNGLSTLNLCEPKLENTQGKLSSQFCNTKLTKTDLNALTYLVVNTPDDFVKKTVKMSDFSKGDKSSFSFSTINNKTTFSVSFWIKINSVRDYWRGIMRIGTDSDQFRLPGIWIIPNQTGIHFRVSTNSNWNDGFDFPTGLLSLGKWYNFVYVVSNDQLRIYYNGKPMPEYTVRFSDKIKKYDPTTMSLYLNNYNNLNDGSAEISKLRVYPIELSDDFVKNIIISEVPTDNKPYYNCMDQNKNKSIQESHLTCMNLIFEDTTNEGFTAIEHFAPKSTTIQLKDNSMYKLSDIAGFLRRPSFRIINGVCFFSGTLRNPNNGVFALLPENARPDRRLSFVAGHTMTCRIDIEPNGNVALYGTTDGYLSLDSIHYVINTTGTAIKFEMSKLTHYVRLSLSTGNPLSVSEIRVFDGTINVSEGKRTIQSSTVISGDSDRAVDGKIDGNWANKNVTHTDTANSTEFLEIDLQGGYNVSSVQIHNRTDCCMDRILNAKISLLDINKNEIDKAIWTESNRTISASKLFPFTVDRSSVVSTNWANYTDIYKNANHRQGMYNVIGNTVYLTGVIAYRGGKIKDNLVIGRVGNEAKPDSIRVCNALVDETNARVDIDTDGNIILRTFDINKKVWDWVSLDSISYVIKSPSNMSLNNPFFYYQSKTLSPIYTLAKYNTYDPENKVVPSAPFEVPNISMMGNSTISMWINTKQNGRQNPIAKGYSSEGTITIEPNGLLSYYYGIDGKNSNGSAYQGHNSFIPITYNQWNHICIVRDFQNRKLYWYINGKLTSNAKTEGPSLEKPNDWSPNNIVDYTYCSESKQKLFIGKGYVNNFVGKIADLKIFNTALSEIDIQELIKSSNNKFAKPFITKDTNNIITMGGMLSVPRNLSKGLITTLPEGFRPNKTLVLIANQNGKIAKFALFEDGRLVLEHSDPSTGFISLDGISYLSYKY